MIAAVGDLVEDVVVTMRDEIHRASDTDAVVIHRRGGSAANVAATIARSGGRARFIGQVGDDPLGRTLTADLAALGVDLAVRHHGRTGTIVVLVGADGERTMLSDRGAATALDDIEPTCLDGVRLLHIPYYSLVGEPLATTTAVLAATARALSITVSVDASSSALLAADDRAIDRIRSLAPGHVFANEDEADVLGDALSPRHLGGAVVVVKRGARPALLDYGDGPVEVTAERIADVRDTTGAGDAFAAGYLMAIASGAPPRTAVRNGHAVAATAIRRVSLSARGS